MIWAVSLLTTKLSPRRLTHPAGSLAFAVWLGLVTSTWPRAHPVLYLQSPPAGGCTSMHFGENQLSPRSVGISPLPTSHPPVLQHWWVRASTDFHIRFTLLMGSSRGFGSLDGYLPRSHKPGTRPVQTRFPSGSPPLLGVNRATAKHSPDHSTKGTPSAPWWLLPQWPLTAGAFAASRSLSSPLRCAFPISLTVLVRYRSRQLFSLGGWSPRIPTG